MIRYALIASLVFGLIWTTVNSEESEPEKGKIYRKYHPDGVVEFTDKPIKGADELKAEEVPTYRFKTPALEKSASPPKAPSTAPSTPPLRTKKLSPPTAAGYQSLAITSPTRDQTIRANDGTVNVSYTLLPALQQHNGHKLVYLLDGRTALTTSQPQPLKNVARGTHTLVLQVVDKNDKILIHSESVSFHVMRFFKPRSQKAPEVPTTPPDFDAENET